MHIVQLIKHLKFTLVFQERLMFEQTNHLYCVQQFCRSICCVVLQYALLGFGNINPVVHTSSSVIEEVEGTSCIALYSTTHVVYSIVAGLPGAQPSTRIS